MNIRLIIIFLAIFLSCVFNSPGQDIYYGTGQWDENGLGNHRAVIEAYGYAHAARVVIPWRRLDNIDNKDLILVDALTGVRVNNIFTLSKNRDSVEIVFEPVSGEGRYFLYYMPGKNTGRWWHPDAIYAKPSGTSDPVWKRSIAGRIDKKMAKLVAIESKSDYHSFYPMEIPVTKAELDQLLDKNKDKEFLVFPESRNFPVRMTETIPFRWLGKGANSSFEGHAMRDESFAWQLAVYAPYHELNDVRLAFFDLKSEDGTILPSKSMKCINMGGKDHLGKNFVKNVRIPKGEVRSMWIITDIKADQKPGTYTGKVSVSADGTKTYLIEAVLTIEDKVAENRGYNTPQNQSRLNWLDSDIGLDNEVVAPYEPVKISGRTISVLGRKMTYNKSGFPEKVSCYFTESNHSITNMGKNVLSGAVRLDLLKGGKILKFSSGEPEITNSSSGAVIWQTTLSSADAEILVKAKMECDGYINYETRIRAKKELSLDDVKLVVPYNKATAVYLMGMGKQGGYTPDKLEWKWDQKYANNMIWIGDVNAGMQLKLKHLVPDWKLATFETTGPYRDWSNNGKGGCNVNSSDSEVIVNAYTGSRDLKKGEEMILNFGLLITPFHTMDDKHWNERYYHADNDPVKAAALGATIMNIHHANLYNPYINYPFLAGDNLTSVVKKARSLGIRTKLYYTVRELSTHLPELWALRQLDDEIFSRANVIALADTHTERDPNDIYGMTGDLWLLEHLRTNYDPAWHDPSIGGDGDMSIRTQGLSRWHNYYIEGLNFLISNYGVRGLYLDGVGYDREIMKRMRKTMDNAADSCLIDFHSGNAFQEVYGLNSPANNYTELFPYVNSLWLGEMYDYNKSSPDYWMVEISGIPFGLYGEMLQSCGNPYRGMVYGMSTRFYGGCEPMNIWRLWDSFGMNGSEYIGYWDSANPVQTGRNDVLAGVYKKDGKILVAIGNWTDSDKMISLKVNWEKLGIDTSAAKIEIPEIDSLQEKGTTDLNNLKIPASKGLILIISY